jgi:hypothetical protein
MGDIAYLVITPDGKVQQVFGPLGVKDMQMLLGGDFDILPKPTNLDITVFARADAKRVGLNPNWLATSLVKNRLRPDDFVAGPVVISGLPDNAGEPTGVSVTVEEAIRRLTAK